MSSVEKQYVYKIFDNDRLIGLVTSVENDFHITKEINSAGSSVEITIPSAFQEFLPSVDNDYLIDDNGDFIIDNNNQEIVTRLDYLVYSIPLIGMRLVIIEVSDDSLAGVTQFDGIITKYSADYTDNSIKLSAFSYGVQLDNFIVQVLPESVIVRNAVALASLTSSITLSVR